MRGIELWALPVRLPGVKKIICALALTPAAASSLSGQVTFYKDVAPILIENCVVCHRKGQSAPFPLVTYEDVKSKASLIGLVTETRYMPPWIADPEYRNFDGERRLTDAEILTIKKWIDQGKPAGPGSMPPLPDFAANSLISRKPDLILEMKSPFVIPGDNKETFAVIKYPGELAESRNVESIEFIPGNRKLVHHVNYEIIPIPDGIDHFGGNQAINLGQYSYNMHVFSYLNLIQKDAAPPGPVYYCGWVPGQTPPAFGEDMGFVLPKRFAVVANTVHYDATPVDDFDNSRFYLFFKDEPAERQVKLMNIGSGGISKVEPPLQIPPGRVMTFSTVHKLTEDISVLYIGPHMHMTGKRFIAYAVPPLADTIPLIRIREWDFNWQEVYRLNPPLHLEKGTTVYVRGTYDNTASNPNNPFNPPRTIESTGFMETTNEMLNLMVLYVGYKPGDEKRLLK